METMAATTGTGTAALFSHYLQSIHVSIYNTGTRYTELARRVLGIKSDKSVLKADLNSTKQPGTAAPGSPTRPFSGRTDLVGGAVDVAVGLKPAGVGPDESLGERNVETALDVHRHEVLRDEGLGF
jgi:hypothetical protein